MMAKMLQCMGNGHIIELTKPEMEKDIEEGTKHAAERCGASPLTKDEMKHLFDIYSSPRRFVSVEPGNEIVLTCDNPSIKATRATDR